MATDAELKALALKTSLAIPKIDYQVGIPNASAKLIDVKSLPSYGASITYNPVTNTVHVKADNLVLSGYNFSGVTVSVEANNVTIKNSNFDASNGVYALTQANGKSGLVVDHNNFDGLKLNKYYADFINGGDGKITITYNQFLNVQSDSIQLKNGVVDHNYFSGTGYMTGAHADAISIDGTTGPISITNNFIDSRKAPDAIVEATSAIAVGNYFGNNKDIEISKNILLGGAYSVYVTDFGVNKYSKIAVADNLVGGGLWGDLYPSNKPAALVYSGNSSSGLEALSLGAPLVKAATAMVKGTAGLANELLKGSDGTDYVYGHGDSNVIVGGGGRDFLFGGKGVDIFTYKNLSDSSLKAQDVIGGFQDGADKINLSAISSAAPMKFIGDAAFSGKAGEIHTVKSAASTFVELDVNGDKVADLRIELQGQHKLSAIDFIL